MPERIPRPNEKQAVQLQEMGVVVLVEPDKRYWACTLPEGWRWEDESDRGDLPDWCVVDQQQRVRISVQGSWKGSYDNKLSLYIKTTNSDGDYPAWKPSFRYHHRRYREAISEIDEEAEDAQQKADEAFAAIIKIYEALEPVEREQYKQPKRVVFERPATNANNGDGENPVEEKKEEDDYATRLKDRLKQLEFATSHDGAIAGYGRCIPAQFPYLVALREENPEEHGRIIESNSSYKKLYAQFPGWSDPNNLTRKYEAMDQGVFAAIARNSGY